MIELEKTKKFRSCFENMAVYKDLKNSNFFSTLGLPSFMRDWLLQKHQNENGEFDAMIIADFVNKFLPGESGWFAIKARIVNDYERVKILAKIIVDINIASSEISFSLPDYGVTNSQTMITPDVWEKSKEHLISGKEVWGILELGYRPPDDSAKPKIPGKIRLISFRDFCPYEIDVEYFKDIRAEFSLEEWLDILLGAVDYSPQGYEYAKKDNPALPDLATMKTTFLSRLTPFVEKRLNLIEMAPKGTGKSYVFGNVSRYGWLSTSDRMTRAKLFYDMSKRVAGLVSQNDFITLDEIQKTCFDEGMGAILQGYLEQGTFTVGNYSGSAHCGMMLCGNIDQDLMERDGKLYMFANLPSLFHESALIDRFHGFIKGWNIPRMNDDLKVHGWALNSEYYTAILHELRNDSSYRAIVDELLDIPKGADTRDTEAIKRIATAFMKLFFPNIRDVGEVKVIEFENFCLMPAMRMRHTIKQQLNMMDKQYKAAIPQIKVRGK